MEWTHLELWRASSLAAETARVSADYEALLASGDKAGLAALRKSIEERIDALDEFFVENVDDDRGVLFEKQRLKLRKLLHRTPAARLASASGGGAKEDARLTLAEMLVWFLKTGQREVRGLTEEVLTKLFNGAAAHSSDGRMSVRELRSAFKAHAQHGSGGSPGDAGGAGAAKAGGSSGSRGRGSASASPATPGMRTPRSRGVGAGAGAGAGAGTSAGSSRGTGRKANGSGTPKYSSRGGDVDGGTAGSVASSTRRRRKKTKAIYAWEKKAAEDAELEAGAAAGGDDDAPVHLSEPLEFQIIMTADEYAAYACARRARAAERKHVQRRAAVAPSKPRQDVTLTMTGPYVEPSTLENTFYRNANPKKWITKTGFKRSQAPETMSGPVANHYY